MRRRGLNTERDLLSLLSPGSFRSRSSSIFQMPMCMAGLQLFCWMLYTGMQARAGCHKELQATPLSAHKQAYARGIPFPQYLTDTVL